MPVESVLPESPAGGLPGPRMVSLPEHWPPPRDDDAVDRAGGGAPGAPADPGQALPRQFAILLAEGLSGVRPVRQLMPWMSSRGGAQLHRLLPLFAGGHHVRVLRVLTASPVPDVIEMTIVVAAGPRTRALAIRLERHGKGRPHGAVRQNAVRQNAARQNAAQREKLAAPWLCTDIEAG